MNRKAGTASVEEHPKGSGKYRVRARIGNKLVTVASGLTQGHANEAAGAYAELRDKSVLRAGLTLDQFGGGFLDRRERRGLRAIAEDRNRWKVTIKNDPIGDIPVASLRRADVIEWRDRLLGRKLAGQTVRNALNLLRVALAEALDREITTQNVARDVKVDRRMGATSLEDLSGVLTPREQAALLAAVPAEHEALFVVGLLTGLRWSELSWLRREDVKGDALLVRRSRKGGPTKSGKPRRVPLLGTAKEAIKAQLATLSKDCRWIFPSEDGTPRVNRPRAWAKWVKAAGIKRTIRWHDLRHTCATSLLAGWWSDQRWTLDEVCLMLGHANISTTERYARKLDETLKNAAARMAFPGGNGTDPSVRNHLPALGFLNRRSHVRIVPGAPQKTSQIRDPDASLLGTSRELPDSLDRAVKRTSARTTDGAVARRLARAYTGAVTGNPVETISNLKAASRLVGGAS